MADQLERGNGGRLAGVIVLDARALIALISSDDTHHEWALEMFRDAVAFDWQMSALTAAEAMVHPAKAGKLEKFQKLLSNLEVEIVVIESNDSLQLAKLRATTSLKMPDVAVIHQALKVSGSVATTDQKLANAARGLGVGVFQPTNKLKAI